jgi:hypothetical protein
MENRPMIKTKTAKSSKSDKSNRALKPKRIRHAEKKAQLSERNERTNRSGALKPVGRRPRTESKQQVCLDLLSRPDGANIDELRDATGWQAHSARGFLSGAVKRKLAT